MVYGDGEMGWWGEDVDEPDERAAEVEELFVEVGVELAIRIQSGEDVGVALEEWVGVEGMSVPDEWGCDWMWGIEAEQRWDEGYWASDEVGGARSREGWEVWADREYGEEEEPEYEREWREVDDEECLALYSEELDEARWSNPLETSTTREGLLEVLEHLDDWDVHVEVKRGEYLEVEEVVVTSLSGAWDTFEGRWAQDEAYAPLY